MKLRIIYMSKIKHVGTINFFKEMNGMHLCF